MIKKITFLFFMSILIIPSNCFAESNKHVAIVIDDFGNGMKGTNEILSLPIPLTVAVMPFLSTTQRDAELAYEKGHEVIVHLPMEPQNGKKSWLGPGAITEDLSEKEIRKRVNEAVDAVPHAVGMNNHMGSKITSNKRIMQIILEECQKRGLYYLDSKTSSKSVVPMLAEQLDLPYLENQLFFDEQYTTSHIIKQANLLVKKLDSTPQMIAIGHVGIAGEKTAIVLKEYVPIVKEKAKPVTLSDLLIINRNIIDIQ